MGCHHSEQLLNKNKHLVFTHKFFFAKCRILSDLVGIDVYKCQATRGKILPPFCLTED